MHVPRPHSGRPKVPEFPTPGKEWRWKRNLIICLAAHHGSSHRLLAEVFDLPHSRIAAIIKEFREKYGSATWSDD